MVDLDTVVLDVDGTLVDTVYVHVAAWRAAFADVGIDVPTYRIHRAIGMGGDRLVAEVAGDAAERAVGDGVRERHAHHFDQRFGEVAALDGAADLVTTLQERGLTVVVASSGEQAQTDRLLELVGNASLLHGRVSGSEADHSKPAPDLLEVALQRVGADRALAVGDAIWDVEAARKAGVPCLAVLTGGFGAAELREAGAAEVAATPREVVERFDELVKAAGFAT